MTRRIHIGRPASSEVPTCHPIHGITATSSASRTFHCLGSAMRLLVVAAAFAWLLATPSIVSAYCEDVVPLHLFWNNTEGDNFSTSTGYGEVAARDAGYQLLRADAYVFPTPQPGTKALKLYWSALRRDYFTTATVEGETAALTTGYVFIRTEGHVYPTSLPGTVPLKLYWSFTRQDNFTTGTLAGEIDALQAGYQFVRIEGYGYPTSTSFCEGGGTVGPAALNLYWSPNRGDTISSATAAGDSEARAAGYEFVRTEAIVHNSVWQPGTVPLKQYWHAGRGDNFATATEDGQNSALAAGYQFVRVEGWVFPTSRPGTVPLRLYWNDSLQDNMTVGTAASARAAVETGYQFIRIEGHVQIYSLPSGTRVRLRHTASGQCLYNSDPVNGGEVRHWGCWGDPNMVYILDRVPAEGPYAVRLRHLLTGSCLYGDSSQGGPVHHWGCWDDPNMVYYIYHPYYPYYPNGSHVRLLHKASGNWLSSEVPGVNGNAATNWGSWWRDFVLEDASAN